MLDGAEEPVPARTSLVRPKARGDSMEDAAAARRILFSRAVLTDLQGKREEEKGRGVDEGLLEGLLDAAGAAAADADVPDCDEGVEDADDEGFWLLRQGEIVDAPEWSGDVVSACSVALTSVNSSFGRERASATTLALPSRYLMSVVNSEIQADRKSVV